MASLSIISAAPPRRPLSQLHPWLGTSAVAMVLALGGLLMPEQPQLQEQICQRYGSAEACQVW
jgi:hypothetical protein